MFSCCKDGPNVITTTDETELQGNSVGPKLIAVMGGTGLQGGSVVKAFHALKESGNADFEVRVITRNPTSEKAKTIEPFTKEIVKADADDEESMIKAFEGCYGAFIVSNFWEDMDVRHEMKTIRTIKEAAKKSALKHILLSTLEDTRVFVNEEAEDKDSWKVLDEELGMYVPHLDGKGVAFKEFQEELPEVTSTFYTSFYYENYINFGMGPARQADTDPYAITFPMGDKKLAMVSVADIGKRACAIFQDETWIGKDCGRVYSAAMTGQEIADTFTKVCKQPVQYNAVPTDVYASFGFPGAEDLANMFRYNVETEGKYLATRTKDSDFNAKIDGIDDFEGWVTANKEAFVLG